MLVILTVKSLKDGILQSFLLYCLKFAINILKYTNFIKNHTSPFISVQLIEHLVALKILFSHSLDNLLLGES
jgi:hypothetical protein